MIEGDPDTSSGFLAFTAGNSERVRINSSGNVGIGTSSPNSTLEVNGAGRFTRPGNTNQNVIVFCDAGANRVQSNSDTGNAKQLLITNNATGAGIYLQTKSNNTGVVTNRHIVDAIGRQYLMTEAGGLLISSEATNDTSNNFLECKSGGTAGSAGSGTLRMRVFNSGSIQNSTNSYAGLSDAKLKENIVDASSQWEDIKAIRLRNYNFKEETGQATHKQLGVIAQEIEQVSPGLVHSSPDKDEEGNDLGTETKGVSYSVLHLKALGALQEAMAKIETLETKVAALEAAN